MTKIENGDKPKGNNIREQYMQLLCIDAQVPDAQVFVDSVNAQTRAIVCSTMPPFLPARINRIGFVFILDRRLLWFGPEQEKRMVQLIRDREIKQIDFLACNTLRDPTWRAYYSRLTEQTGVVIGASKDRTGNLNYGGNWIMERTGEDIERLYFTSSIHYYKYLLDDGNNVTQAILDASTCQNLSDEISITNVSIQQTLDSIEDLFLQTQPIITEFQTDFAAEAKKQWDRSLEIASLWNNTTLNRLAFTVYVKSSDTENYQKEVLRNVSLIQDNVSTAQSYRLDANQYNASALQSAIEAENAAIAIQSGNNVDDSIQIIGNSLDDIQGTPLYQGYQTRIEITNASMNQLKNEVITLFENVSTQRQLTLKASEDVSIMHTEVTQLDDLFKENPFLSQDIKVDCIIPLIDSTGTLYTIGNNTLGQSGLNTLDYQLTFTKNASQVSSVGTTRQGMIYLKNGQLFCSGQNEYGELGNIPWFSNASTSIQSINIPNITQFSAGLDHVLFLDNQNYAYSLGLNTYGQLGKGDNLNTSVPTLITEMIGTFAAPFIIKQVACGLSHSVFLTPDNTVLSCGFNLYGQLGIGSIENSTILMELNMTKVTQIACGSNHTLCLKKETVYACGNNASGQLGLPIPQSLIPVPIPGLSHIVSISANGDLSAALDIVGNLWIWGSNESLSIQTPSIQKTQVTYVEITPMGIFYVSNQKYYVFQSKSPLLQDGQIMLDDVVPLFRIQSNICFPADTPVTTDQGDIAIQDLLPFQHTIRGKSIVAITETYSSETDLIVFEQDALFTNYPSKRTLVTREHKIFYECQWIEAHQFVNYRSIYEVSYQGDPLYNVLLEEHGRMKVNNLIVETLDPNNMIGKIFKKYYEVTNNKRI